MTRRLLPIILSCFAIAVAQAKPNFSGTWNLNIASSEFGPAPKPDKVVTTLSHKDPDLEITSEATGPQGPRTTKFKYTTDGKETTMQMGPAEFKGAAKWDGDVLVIETKGQMQGNDLVLTDKWSLSEDGKKAKMTRHIKVTQGEFDQTYVYDKQ